MADECNCNRVGTIVIALLAGAAVGGAIALLTAPRSGRETREKLREAADDALERVRDIAAEAEANIRHAVEEGGNVLHEKQETVRAVVEAGKKAYEKQQAKHR